MKLSDLSTIERPAIARFNDTDDSYSGVIVKEPEWQDDQANNGKQMLVIAIKDDKGIFWQINARTQMPDAIRDAVIAADAEALEVGGHLTVTFVEYSGQAKIYRAVYEPPQESAPF